MGKQPDDALGECAMCLESMDDGDQVSRRLACGHFFHSMCLDDLAAASLRDRCPAKCPLCRAPVARPIRSPIRRPRRPIRREVDRTMIAAFELSVCGTFVLGMLMLSAIAFSSYGYNPSPPKSRRTGVNTIRVTEDNDDDNTMCSPNKQCIHTVHCDGMGRCTTIEPLVTRVSIDQLDERRFSTTIHVTNHQHYSSLINSMVTCKEDAPDGRESTIRIKDATMQAEPLDTTMVNLVFDHSGDNPVVCHVVVREYDDDTAIYSSTHKAYTPESPSSPIHDQALGRQSCELVYMKDRVQHGRRFFSGTYSRYDDDDNDNEHRLTRSGSSEDDAGFPCCTRGL